MLQCSKKTYSFADQSAELCKMILIIHQSSQIYLSPKKLRKLFTFQYCKFLNDKIDQSIYFANSFCRKFRPQLLRDRKEVHWAMRKKTLSYYSCQLVTQQPKETCQRTCRGPICKRFIILKLKVVL